MNKLTIGGLVMALALSTTEHVFSKQVTTPSKADYKATSQLAEKKEVLAVTQLIQRIGSLADAGDFQTLQGLYAEQVMVDYSSLSGEVPSLKSAEKLMSEWAAVLPGFDLTQHSLNNIDVNIEGNKATATADVVAEHFVDSLFWQVSGSYYYELYKPDNEWQVVYHQFNLIDEIGTRDVFSVAIENAQSEPSEFLARKKAQAVVTQFLTSLEEKDMQSFASVWTEDAVQDMPYSPEGFPKRVSGKQNLIAHYAAWPEISGAANFTENLRFYPMQDASTVFAEWTGEVEVLTTGKLYQQTYGGLFHIEEGKIALFREYYDPNAFANAFLDLN